MSDAANFTIGLFATNGRIGRAMWHSTWRLCENVQAKSKALYWQQGLLSRAFTTF